jgi:nucleoside-diphosphate-sugar epimerase
MQDPGKPVVVIMGSSGLIGTRLSRLLVPDYHVVGLDIKPPAEPVPGATWIECDLTDDKAVPAVLHRVAKDFGDQFASVVHLAAYYDFSGEPSSLYQDLTIEGTRRLLKTLQRYQVQQFAFVSTLLVMEPAESGARLTAFSPTQAEWDYPQSKLAAEEVIHEERGEIPVVILRLAGAYDEDCHSVPLAQQISRIHQKQLESFVFPGVRSHGQSFIHLNDVAECLQRTIEYRARLGEDEIFLVGEEDVMGYDELQDAVGELIHGRQWPTIRIPKAAAKAGAWVKEKAARGESEEPFIRPWMIDLADQNYPVDLQHLKDRLDWQPQYTLRATLPEMARRLKQSPRRWYEENQLPAPDALAED